LRYFHIRNVRTSAHLLQFHSLDFQLIALQQKNASGTTGAGCVERRGCKFRAAGEAARMAVDLANVKRGAVKFRVSGDDVKAESEGVGHNSGKQLPKVIGGVRFQDGIAVIEVSANRAA
jgi:hypothetical protein